MTAVEKLEQRDSDEKVVEIELERLRSFEKHPFKVQADSQMIELQESIKKYGILNPLIVRPRLEGVYEIISGHRRKFAAEQLGYWKVPVIIRYMKDDEAVISMPRSFIWKDGHEYEIQRVKHVQRAASLKAGGVGLRYTCIIDGKESHLFYEDNNMWFVEGK